MATSATDSWGRPEADPQRRAILDAADRLLSGAPHRSTGNLSIVQLATEAEVKYWVVAQKHPDLRAHFQHLAMAAEKIPVASREEFNAHAQLKSNHAALREHCEGLEQLVRTYALAINEISLENSNCANSSPPRQPQW